jgi:hypothetical protein
MNNVTPRGRYIYLDVDAYLEEYQDADRSAIAAPAGRLPDNQGEQA